MALSLLRERIEWVEEDLASLYTLMYVEPENRDIHSKALRKSIDSFVGVVFQSNFKSIWLERQD